MDLKTIAIYGLAGFGAYKLYENLTAMSNYSGTAWQRDGIRGTAWQDANTNFTGTEWQQAGRNRETMWQEGLADNSHWERPSNEQAAQAPTFRPKMRFPCSATDN